MFICIMTIFWLRLVQSAMDFYLLMLVWGFARLQLLDIIKNHIYYFEFVWIAYVYLFIHPHLLFFLYNGFVVDQLPFLRWLYLFVLIISFQYSVYIYFKNVVVELYSLLMTLFANFRFTGILLYLKLSINNVFLLVIFHGSLYFSQSCLVNCAGIVRCTSCSFHNGVFIVIFCFKLCHILFFKACVFL